MTSTFAAGIAHIRAIHAANIGANNCKLRTREAFDVLSNGTATASKSWSAAPDQHKDRNPSRAPAYSFGWMTGGGKGSGHVVVNLGGGRILTPGGPADPSHWYETTAAELLRRWPNLKWVGWTRSIDGKYPAQPKTAAPKPDPTPHATELKRKIYHDDHYAKANSPAGDKIAAARHEWADRDLQPCLRGRRRAFINTHWDKPSVEGFRTPDGKVPRLKFRVMRWATIATLSTKDGWKIRTATQAMRDAKALGVPGIEFELKFLPTQAALDRLAAAARKIYGDHWAERVEIKMLTQFRWRAALKRAKKAEFKTTLIRYSGDPKNLPHYVDHYRR